MTFFLRYKMLLCLHHELTLYFSVQMYLSRFFPLKMRQRTDRMIWPLSSCHIIVSFGERNSRCERTCSVKPRAEELEWSRCGHLWPEWSRPPTDKALSLVSNLISPLICCQTAILVPEPK